jgi:hypothetical protein
MFPQSCTSTAAPERRVVQCDDIGCVLGRPNRKKNGLVICFYEKDQGINIPLLKGYSTKIYNNLNKLITLYYFKLLDRLTMFIKNYLGFIFKVNTYNNITTVVAVRLLHSCDIEIYCLVPK